MDHVDTYAVNCTAYKLVKQGASAEVIRAAGQQRAHYSDVYIYPDGSCIELSKWGHHQAHAANGWNVTPR